MGIYDTSSGIIAVNGKKIRKGGKKKIGYLPQAFGLFEGLTLQDSMKYFGYLKGINSSQMKEEIHRCLEAVYLSDKKSERGERLSGGMIRRAGVAQAMLGAPELLLFDEPTAGLDPEERMHFKNILSNFGKNETVIVSTHIVEDIEVCCDFVIIMNNGRILTIGTCSDIISYAAGKVYELSQKELDGLAGNFHMQKKYVSHGEIFYRIIMSENIVGRALEPDLEDGYMCMVKGI